MVEYEWDAAGGEKAMAQAMEVVDAAARHPSGRLSGMVAPSQIDTCTPELIRESFAEAERARPALPDPCGTKRRRIPRDDPAPRHDADRMAGIVGVLSPRADHRARHLSRPHSSALNWPSATISLPSSTAVPRWRIARWSSSARHRHPVGGRLSAPGRENGDRHRHLPPQHAGGAARGGDRLAHGLGRRLDLRLSADPRFAPPWAGARALDAR